VFGPVGGPEFLLLLVLALLLFGPRKLPEIGKSLGRALAEFRGATNEFRSSLEREVEVERVRTADPPAGTVSNAPAGPSAPARTDREDDDDSPAEPIARP
jgi:TatA/E family protein of Tat protein translocase